MVHRALRTCAVTPPRDFSAGYTSAAARHTSPKIHARSGGRARDQHPCLPLVRSLVPGTRRNKQPSNELRTVRGARATASSLPLARPLAPLPLNAAASSSAAPGVGPPAACATHRQALTMAHEAYDSHLLQT